MSAEKVALVYRVRGELPLPVVTADVGLQWNLPAECGVPFTFRQAIYEASFPVNGLRGAPRPLCNPRGPAAKSVLRTAFACELQPAARRNSTLLVPSLGLALRANASVVQNCSRQFCRVSVRLSPPSWRPDLVFPSPAHRFQAGTHRFQRLRFLLLAKRLQRHRWRLNRRSVACRPGQPTGMWAEGAALQGCYLAPDPKAGRHKLREPRSGDSAARARGCRGRRQLSAPCALLAPFDL